jgi:hypothetical protein
MATLLREDIPDAAREWGDVDFPEPGVSHAVWSDADDQYSAAAWLQRFVSAVWTGNAKATGYVEGERDAIRYAIEAGGQTLVSFKRDGDDRRWFARSTRIRILAEQRDGALALLDGWTAGVVIALCLADGKTLATIVRSGDGGIVVALGQVASTAAWQMLDKLPTGPRPQRREMPAPRVGSLTVSRPRVVAAALAMVVIAATATGITLWRTHSGSTESSAASQLLRAAPDTPSFASISLLVTDSMTGHLLLVGCCDRDSNGAQSLVSTWSWSGAQWTHLHPPKSPEFVRDATLAPIGGTGSFVFVGGGTDAGAETWIWDGQSWTLLNTFGAVPAHSGPMVYDVARGRVITLSHPPLNTGTDTWAFQQGTWTKVATTGPALFLQPAAAFDPDTKQLVLVETDGITTTTWTFANDTWTSRPSPAGFSLDPTTQLAWDGVYHRVVAVHLGDAAVPARNSTTPADTWIWDGSAWTKLETPSAPNENGRLLTTATGRAVFIGDHVINGSPEVWEWAGTTWRLRTGNVSDLFSGTAGIAFHFDQTLLDAAGWALRLGGAHAIVDSGSARDAAYKAVPAPGGVVADVHIRLWASDQAIVTDTIDPRNPVVCECWVEDLLVTTRPATCPDAEVVLQETLVLVDIKDGRVIKTYSHTPAPGTTFGSCQQTPITTP